MKENILYILYESGSVVAQLCPILCDSMVCAWNSPGKNTGVGGHSLLQGIFPTQGSNPGLLHCRQILYYLSYQRSHYMLKVIKIMLVLLTTLCLHVWGASPSTTTCVSPWVTMGWLNIEDLDTVDSLRKGDLRSIAIRGGWLPRILEILHVLLDLASFRL